MHQLVIQFPLSEVQPQTAELEGLYALEARLARISDGKFDVDGHDIGAGEMNVFILAEDAANALDLIREHLAETPPWRAGFRDLDSEEYVPLAPAGLAAFNVK